MTGAHFSPRRVRNAAIFAFSFCVALNVFAGGGKTLAKINDQVITEADIDQIVQAIPDRFRGLYAGPEGKQKTLEYIADIVVLAQEAEKAGLDKAPGTALLLEYNRKDALARLYLDKMSKAVATPTDQEARAYYEANRAKFMSPESVHLHHILVKSEAEAKEALNRLKKGEKFADLAAQISTCPSKAKGGNLDWLPKGRLVKEIDEIAFSMQPGKPSRPIQSKFGWHVLLLEEKREPVQNTFEQVQEYIVEQLKAEHQQGNYEKLMQGLRKKNNVEIFGAADAAADAAKK